MEKSSRGNTLKQLIELTINGKTYELEVEPNRTLLEVLREDLGLTGTKYGCGTGECGACTVLVDGKPVLSCATLGVAVEGKNITTVEGLAQKERLHPLQTTFIQHGAIQCGFCTPGILLTAKALLDENPAPTANDIRQFLKGNLCRCTGYDKIIEAVLAAAQTREERNTID
jgi:carbon-monoxide dehydrogenase small subunit